MSRKGEGQTFFFLVFGVLITSLESNTPKGTVGGGDKTLVPFTLFLLSWQDIFWSKLERRERA